MKQIIEGITYEVSHTERTESKKAWNDVTNSVTEISVIVCVFVGTVNGNKTIEKSFSMYKSDDIEKEYLSIFNQLQTQKT